MLQLSTSIDTGIKRKDFNRITCFVAFAVLPGSHHHKVGNAEMPYFGNGSGRSNRSQRAVRSLF
jgi:hypothetical protein